MTLFIGIDGGGSHCRALLKDSKGTVLGEGLGGPANPVSGVIKTQRSVLDACYQALDNAGLSRDTIAKCYAGAGLAGLHLPAMHSAMEEWAHPFKRLFLTTDLHAAVMGAHQGRDGAVLILGTGFSAMAVKGSEQLCIGGMGFPINAAGSGSWLGLEAVKAVLLAEDKLGPDTMLSDLLLSDTSLLALANKTVNGDAYTFGQYAPLVFKAAQQGDHVATHLLDEATTLAENVILKMVAFGAPKTVLIGSVANALFSRFSNKVKGYITQEKASPQCGAILLAQQQLLTQPTPTKGSL